MVKKQRNKIKPYKTTPYREGCHSQKEYTLPFKDSVGNTALITYCDFVNKKGVLVEGHVLYVKWVNELEYCDQIVSCIKSNIFMECEIVPHFESAFYEIVDELNCKELDMVLHDIRQDSPLYKIDAFWKLLKLSSIICAVELARLEGKYE